MLLKKKQNITIQTTFFISKFLVMSYFVEYPFIMERVLGQMVLSENSKDIINLLPIFKTTHIKESIRIQIDVLKKAKLKVIADESIFLERVTSYFKEIDIHEEGDKKYDSMLSMLKFASIEKNRARVISNKYDYLKTHIYWTLIDLVRGEVIDFSTSLYYQDLFVLDNLSLYVH